MEFDRKVLMTTRHCLEGAKSPSAHLCAIGY